MQHPDLNFLIQKSIQEDRIRTAATERRIPASHRVNRIRVMTGNALVRIGARIAPEPRPISTRSPVREISLAGRLDN